MAYSPRSVVVSSQPKIITWIKFDEFSSMFFFFFFLPEASFSCSGERWEICWKILVCTFHCGKTRSLDLRSLVFVRKFVKNRRDKQNSDLNLTNTRLRDRLERTARRGETKTEKRDRLFKIVKRKWQKMAKRVYQGNCSAVNSSKKKKNNVIARYSGA